MRVVETLAHVGDGYGRALVPTFDQRVYLASSATLLELVQGTDDGVERLLLVGHNPGLEDLVLTLVPTSAGPRADVEEKFPTASVAALALPVAHWSDLAAGDATLAAFTRPRDLDPALGPDGG